MVRTFDCIKMGGEEIQVTIDGGGVFHAEMDGESYESPTFKRLRTKLMLVGRKESLGIRFVKWTPDERRFGGRPGNPVSWGTVHSIHSGNGNLIVEWDRAPGKREQVQHRGFYGERFLVGGTDLKKLKALHKAVTTATREYERFLEKNRLKVGK